MINCNQPSDIADNEIIREEGGNSDPNQNNPRSEEPEKCKSDENTSDRNPNDDQNSRAGLDEEKVEILKNHVKSATSLLGHLRSLEDCQSIVDQANDDNFIDKLTRRLHISCMENVKSIADLTKLACSLLHLHANFNENVNYKICVDKILNFIYDSLFQNFDPPCYESMLYYYTQYLARALILYPYHMEKDEAVDIYKEKCHPVIVKLVPKLNHIVDRQFDDINVLWINIPRLLTNYLYDKDQYNKDVVSDEMTKFRNIVELDKLKNHSTVVYSIMKYKFYLRLYEIIISNLQ